MVKTKNILFVTTSSLGSNPRLVKEFESLKSHFECVVVSFKHDDWSLELSETIKSRNPEVEFHEIHRPTSVFSTIQAKVLHKLAIAINPLAPRTARIAAFASNDKAVQLKTKLKELAKTNTFDRIIAHNLGAFYPSAMLSAKQNSVLQLDIEDFYPGEALYFNKAYEMANRERIMQFAFDRASVITYASEGIKEACLKRYTSGTNTRHETIINVFNAKEFPKPTTTKDANINCVWFSQHIGPNRGLEQVFQAVQHHKTIQFHLIGNANQDFLQAYDLDTNIHLHDIMEQSELHEFLSTMDIGLALEDKNADYNRNICLTNKFLAYIQAGLYVLATDTYGQRHYIDQLPADTATLIETDLNQTLRLLDRSIFDYDRKLKRWDHARSLAWDHEQKKMLALFT